MENGGTNIRSLRNLEIDSLINNGYNHSNYYKNRNYKYTPNARKTFNQSSINYKLNMPVSYRHKEIDSLINPNNDDYNKTYSSINSASEIVNGLQSTIHDANTILNKNKSYLNTDINSEMQRYLPLSKSLRLNRRKKSSKKKKKKKSKKKEISFGKENNYEEKKIEKEKEKINNNKIKELSILRSKLMEKNIDIRKENKILEIEINNYKNQIYSRRFDLNTSNYNYIQMMNKNFGKNKSLLQNSLIENTKLLEEILKKIEINIDSYNQIINDSLANKQLFKKVENYNRENAENQIINEENENKFNELKNNSNELLKKSEEKNIILEDLKNKGNNLMLKYDSNLIKLKKSEELIYYLKNTKNVLEEELNKKTEKMNLNTNKIYQNKKRIIFYNTKLKNLSDEIINLNINKSQILQINAQIKNRLLSYIKNEYNSIKNKNNILLKELKNKYNQAKNINNIKKSQLKKKEQEIEALKKYIDISNLNFEYFSKNKIFNSFKQENNYINVIEIDEKIQSFIKANNKLKNELNKMFLIYDNQIKQKDLLIQNLENQLIKEQSLKKGSNFPDELNFKKTNPKDNNKNIVPQLKNKDTDNQVMNKNQLSKTNYTNIIYNRLNNINDENNSQNNINNNRIDNNNNNFNIDNYFKEKLGKNNEIENKEINTDTAKNTDLDEVIRQNNLNNIKQIKESQKNKINNDNNNKKEPEQELEDLGAIANQISEYNKTLGQSDKKLQKENEVSDNTNEMNNLNIADKENGGKPQEQEQEEDEYEVDLNNVNMMNNEENEEEVYNDLNGENKDDNLIDKENEEEFLNSNVNEEVEIEQDNIDDDNYNYYNDINDIHNEYEDNDENEEQKNL